MAPLRCAAKFDPFLSFDCAPTPSTLTQSKERKGSHFAIWQPCHQGRRESGHRAHRLGPRRAHQRRPLQRQRALRGHEAGLRLQGRKSSAVPSVISICVSELQFAATVGTQIQGSTNRRAPGLVNFVPALAYHFCLNLSAAFTQPGARLLVEPCT